MRVPFCIVRTKSAAETTSLGACIGGLLQPGDALLLCGDLGTGKTTFVKGLTEGLGISEPATSPTFTIMHSHSGGRLPFVHLDLYRCPTVAEVTDLGIDDVLQPPTVTAIEWGEHASSVTGPHHLQLDFAWEADDETRTIQFHASGRFDERMGDIGEAVRSWAGAA